MRERRRVFELTPVEKEIAELYDRGMDVEQICGLLKKSRKSVQMAIILINEKRASVKVTK